MRSAVQNRNSLRGSLVQSRIKQRVIYGPTKRQAFVSSSANLLALVIGIGTNFTIHFVGELYIAEILMLLLLPLFVIFKGKRILKPQLYVIYYLMGLWLLGLVIADVYNHTPVGDRLRGTALIVFFGVDLLVLEMLLSHNDKRKMLFMIGLTVGALLSVKLQPSLALADYPWKFGWASGTIQVVVLVSTYFYTRRRYVVSGLLILGICGVNLILNYRGPVLELLIALVLVHPLIPEEVGNTRILPNSQVARVVVLVVLVIGAGEISESLVHLVTKLGYINEQAQAKNEAQSHSGNLLLGGRPEFAVGLQAALENPIVGRGSWPKDMKYLEMLNDLEVETGELEYSTSFENDANGQIPAHSGIISMWMWGGILALIFWIYFVWFVIKGILKVAIVRPPFAPVYMYLLVSMFWDIFFSPFAASRRITDAFLLMVIADLMETGSAVISGPWRRMGAVNVRRTFGNGQNPIALTRPR